MDKKYLSHKEFKLLTDLLAQKAYYYDDILCLNNNVPVYSGFYFDKAEAEHLNNHIHLIDVFKIQEYNKDDFRTLAELRLAFLKYLYPNLPIIVFLVFDEDGNPILDFGLRRSNEQVYWDLKNPNIEYWQ